MFKKILVANRGECALRIMYACRELGLRTVAVYSMEEEDARHVRYADDAICIGQGSIENSYRNIVNIVAAAKISGCDAIHPGCGFLAEDVVFARSCEDNSIAFIGPNATLIELMSDCESARKAASLCGVPILPGDKNTIESPRHIQVQVIADKHGNRSTLCERDCTIQFKDQNILEEAPATILPKELRRQMMVSALKIIRTTNYDNLGTIEFLFGRDGKFYFLKMASSLQAEYAITEEITGIDIVKEQICVAAGEELSCSSNAIRFPKVQAMEFHIKSLDPHYDFMPCAGSLKKFLLPSGFGLRIDTEFKVGDKVSGACPSTLAKVIVIAYDREECLARAKRVLKDFEIEGVVNTKDYILKILDQPGFIDMGYGKDFIEKEMLDFKRGKS
ncbi:MAG: acetyl-CoA carboxylase biotin carboxylase subunit [Eggerthellaceae bacterium]|nr:acetyl-CoA carboxylase biotin carboxylase subunit [Eggerthellaceae bacterium]